MHIAVSSTENTVFFLKSVQNRRNEVRAYRFFFTMGHRFPKLKIRAVCDILCIKKIVKENHQSQKKLCTKYLPHLKCKLKCFYLKCVAYLSLAPIVLTLGRNLTEV